MALKTISLALRFIKLSCIVIFKEVKKSVFNNIDKQNYPVNLFSNVSVLFVFFRFNRIILEFQLPFWTKSRDLSGDVSNVKHATTIYKVGYFMSLIAVTVAAGIFMFLSELKCLRNKIHMHLFITYLFFDLTWIIKLYCGEQLTNMKVNCETSALLVYLLQTNFFWMFVEGLYLYLLVARTFSAGKIKFRIYIFIGWLKSNDTTNTVEDLKFTGILQTDLNCYIAPPGVLVPKYPIWDLLLSDFIICICYLLFVIVSVCQLIENRMGYFGPKNPDGAM
ncbi:Diuretic hormone receptor [Nymphon striatum]|nr:Diuretic hormone receptor [Nymphon striatum]